jgi:hypothetical protein
MESKRMLERIWGWTLVGALAVGMTVCVPTISFAQAGGGASSARERWEQMSPEQKGRMRERSKRWQELEPQQREEVKRKFERFKQLPPEERERIVTNWKRYRI